MRFCEKCGEGNDDGARFCIQCGAGLPAGPPAEGVGDASPPGAAPGGTPPPAGTVPPPVQAPAPGYYPPPVPQAAPTDGFAIASLVLAVFSFMGCPFVAAVLGLVFGYMSLGRIEQSNGALGGEPLAKAGVIISWIHIGLALFTGVLVLILVLTGVILTR